MFQAKVVEKTKRTFYDKIFRKSCCLWDNVEKILYSRASHRWQQGVCALYAGHLRIKIYTQNKYYLLIFHYNNGCKNASQYYVIHELPVLQWLNFGEGKPINFTVRHRLHLFTVNSKTTVKCSCSFIRFLLEIKGNRFRIALWYSHMYFKRREWIWRYKSIHYKENSGSWF